MKLGDMSPRKVGGVLQFVAHPDDDQRSGRYELTVTGPAALTRQIFKSSDIEVKVRPSATKTDADAAMRDHAVQANAGLASLLEAPHSLRIKRPEKRPNAQDSVYVAIRRLEGKGTLWSINVAPLFVPLGASIFFVLPPVLAASAIVIPAVGDADLFLSLNVPFPSVRSSINGGLTPDAVSFSLLPFPFLFVPFFRVFGFARSVTRFSAIGFDFP
jgi:hypothetical protein